MSPVLHAPQTKPNSTANTRTARSGRLSTPHFTAAEGCVISCLRKSTQEKRFND